MVSHELFLSTLKVRAKFKNMFQRHVQNTKVFDMHSGDIFKQFFANHIGQFAQLYNKWSHLIWNINYYFLNWPLFNIFFKRNLTSKRSDGIFFSKTHEVVARLNERAIFILQIRFCWFKKKIILFFFPKWKDICFKTLFCRKWRKFHIKALHER